MVPPSCNAQQPTTPLPLPSTLEGCQQELQALRAAHQRELEQRQAIEDELRCSKQMLQLVMDTLPEAIFWKDRQFKYLGCNQQFAENSGFKSPEEMVGQDDYDLPWKKEETDWFRECDRRIMESNRAELGIIEPKLCSGGRQLWLETNKAPLHDSDGNVIGVLGTYQDITKRRESEIKLQELNRKLNRQALDLNAALSELQQSQLHLIQSEKLSALGNLVAGVAHEINNPISFLSGNLPPTQESVEALFEIIDLYQRTYPQPDDTLMQAVEDLELDFIRDDLPKMLSSMKEGIKRIREISTSLRTFSRTDTLLLTSFNIHEGLDSTLLILKHRLKANDRRPAIEVEKHYEELPEIQCFAGKLNQVFMNLISNAIDALDESNQDCSFLEIQDNPNRITVTTTVDGEMEQVQIQIADNGPGISEAMQQRIFEEYFTTKGVGKGTGLGLAISHQIINRDHGGTLTLRSQPGQGATFIITLPIHGPQQA